MNDDMLEMLFSLCEQDGIAVYVDNDLMDEDEDNETE